MFIVYQEGKIQMVKHGPGTVHKFPQLKEHCWGRAKGSISKPGVALTKTGTIKLRRKDQNPVSVYSASVLHQEVSSMHVNL